MSNRGHRDSIGAGGRGKKKGSPPANPPPIVASNDTREPFDKLVGRLRSAAEAARTWGEFQAARAAIRSALSIREVEQTDLWAVCEKKRLTFEGEGEWPNH